jgi:hypothetical protein
MALTCARCGAQNPDGNQFCQACGTPLVPAAAGVATGVISDPPAGMAPPPPPAGLPPPVMSPSGYQSPYFVPTAPTPPVHRTPWVLIVGAIVGLVVIMAGFGTAFAVLTNRNTVNTGGGITASLPSPSPEGTPSPIGSPTPISGQATKASNAGVVVPVPAGWTVASRDPESITLADPAGNGFVTVASGVSSPVQNAQQNKDQVDQDVKGRYPDTKLCPNTSTTNGTLNGAKGLFWTLCFTLTSGSRSAPAAAALFAGANGDGSAYYVVMELTTQDNLQKLTAEAKPVLQGIQWKL